MNNETAKGALNVISLMETPATLLRWTISSPIIQEMLTEFEEEISSFSTTEHGQRHSDDTNAKNTTFKRDVQALLRTFIEHGNPFGECGNLYDLETGLVAKQNVENDIKRLKSVDQEQYNTFVIKRLRASQDAPEERLMHQKDKYTNDKKSTQATIAHCFKEKKFFSHRKQIKLLKAEYSPFPKCFWHVSAEKFTLVSFLVTKTNHTH